jgi:hypothetical protein
MKSYACRRSKSGKAMSSARSSAVKSLLLLARQGSQIQQGKKMKTIFKSVLMIGCFSITSAFASGELLTGSYQLVSQSNDVTSDVNCANGNAPSGIQILATASGIQETESVDYGIDGVAQLTNLNLPVGDEAVAGTDNTALQKTGAGVYHAHFSADGASYRYTFIPTDATQGDLYSVMFKLTGRSLEITTTSAVSNGQPMVCAYLKSSY